MAKNATPAPHGNRNVREAELLDRRWLSQKAFEIELSRPAGFDFSPGQTVCILSGEVARDYSMVSSPREPVVTLCVRHVPGGALSPLLAGAAIGTRFTLRGPGGYFTFHPSSRAAVFVATGSGIAPFVSMVKSGVRPFLLLQGARSEEDLYYRSFLSRTVETHVACLSGGGAGAGVFSGRVTDYIDRHLPPASYVFYLCGNRHMIRDVTLLVDDRFPGAYVFTEVFY